MIDHGALHLAARTRARSLVVAETVQTFARASDATFTDVNGVVQTAAPNVLRSAHYVNGVGPQVLLEPSSATNILTYSEDLSNAAWDASAFYSRINLTANAGVAPDGTTTADIITRCAQNATMSPDTDYTLSAYVKDIGGGLPTLSSDFIVRNVALDTDLAPVIVTMRVTFNASVPTPTVHAGAGSVGPVEALANGWYRVSVSFTTPPSFNAITQIAFSSTSFRLQWLWGVELKAESTRTSYVRSVGTFGVRAAETTASIGLVATSTGYSRTSGSFLSEGYAVGMEVTPTGFTQTARGTITALTATTMTISGGRTPEAVGPCSLSVGLPLRFGWANVALGGVNARQSPHPYGEEEYLPGGAPFKQTLGPLGRLIVRPTYVIRIAVSQNTDATALHRYTDALITHFAPTTPLTVAGGTAWVRSDLVPFPSPIAQTEDGWAVVTLSVPLEYHTDNSR